MGSGRVLAWALSVLRSATVPVANSDGRGCGFPDISADGIGGFAFKVLDFAYADSEERITAGEGIPGGHENDQDISDGQEPDEVLSAGPR